MQTITIFNCIPKAKLGKCDLFSIASEYEMNRSSLEKVAQAPGEHEPAKVSSGELLAGRRQLIIQHGSEEYRLRLTSSNKLILTK
jgi:hemin uptake protein HemP